MDEEGRLRLIQKVTAVVTDETRAKRPTDGVGALEEAFLVLPPELLDTIASAFPATPWIYVLRWVKTIWADLGSNLTSIHEPALSADFRVSALVYGQESHPGD